MTPARTYQLFHPVVLTPFAVFILAACGSGLDTGQNSEVVRRYFEEAINQGNMDIADHLVATNFVKHNNDITSVVTGPELLRTAIRTHKENNTDYRFVIQDIYATNDKVTVRWIWHSTNIKYGTPREVISQGISIFRLEDGKISELWQAFDIQGFNKQLGFTVVPPLAAEQQ